VAFAHVGYSTRGVAKFSGANQEFVTWPEIVVPSRVEVSSIRKAKETIYRHWVSITVKSIMHESEKKPKDLSIRRKRGPPDAS
jgi:hypothetical protein